MNQEPESEKYPGAQSDPGSTDTGTYESARMFPTTSSSSSSSQDAKPFKDEPVNLFPAQKKSSAILDHVDASSDVTKGRARSSSDVEVINQHQQIQNRYLRASRKQTVCDIDFEGILRLIGGCNRWQVLIYAIIACQQIPHAMFNLSVVYMMYKPDHWCKVPDRQRDAVQWHDQCHYYNRGMNRYTELLGMNLSAAIEQAGKEEIRIERCSGWEYNKEVMHDTVVTQWNRVCDDNWSRAHVHLSYSLGYILGCTVGGFVSDRCGRKTAVLTFGILSTIFGVLLAFTDAFPVFLVIRFLGAACNEAADLAAYVMCMEVTGVQYRSMVGSMLQTPWACGYALLALVAYISRSWFTIQLVVVLVQMVTLIPVHHLPESPRWLVVMNRMREAEHIIRRACHLNKTSLPSDLGLVRHAEKRKWRAKNLARPRIFQLFVARAIRMRTGILFTMWIATALVYYGLIIALSDQSSPGRSLFVGHFFLNNAIAGAIELPTLVGCVLLLRFGRKRSQMVTLIGAGIMIAIAMLVSTKHNTTLALLFMLAGKVCIQGAFNILYIFTSEMYPTVIRNSAVGICSMVSQMGSGAAGYIAILSDVTLPIVPMLIFSVFSLVAGILVLFLPETQDLPLPDTFLDVVKMLKADTKYECLILNRPSKRQRDEIYGERNENTD